MSIQDSLRNYLSGKVPAFLGLVVLLATTAGCGGGSKYEGPPRVAVSGKITLDGQPLRTGIIAFVAEDKNQRTTSTPFANGQYSFPEGKGPHQGKYKVVISGNAGTESSGDSESPPEGENESGQIVKKKTGLAQYVSENNVVADEFNIESKLTVDTSTESTFDFEVKSKAK